MCQPGAAPRSPGRERHNGAGEGGRGGGMSTGNKSPGAVAPSKAGLEGGEALPQGRPEAAATRGLPGPQRRGPAGASGAGSPPGSGAAAPGAPPRRQEGRKEGRKERAAAASPRRAEGQRRRACRRGPGRGPGPVRGRRVPAVRGRGPAPLPRGGAPQARRGGAAALPGSGTHLPGRARHIERLLGGRAPPPPRCRSRVCLVAAAAAFPRAKMAAGRTAHARPPRCTPGVVVRAASPQPPPCAGEEMEEADAKMARGRSAHAQSAGRSWEL